MTLCLDSWVLDENRVVHVVKASYPNQASTRCGRTVNAVFFAWGDRGLFEEHGYHDRTECPDCRLLTEMREAEQRLEEQGVPKPEELLNRTLFPDLLFPGPIGGER